LWPAGMNRKDLPTTFSLAKEIADVGVTLETEPKRSRTGIRGQASRLRLEGDSELTEPETEDDSLFGDDPGVIEPVIYEREGPHPDSLTTEQILQRRLENVTSLYSIYKVEYWGLVEELRTRHARFKVKQADRASHDPQAAQPAGQATTKKHGLEGVSDLRSLIKRRRGEPGVAEGGKSMPAATSASAERLDEGAQKPQQPEPSIPSSPGGQREYGAGDGPGGGGGVPLTSTPVVVHEMRIAAFGLSGDFAGGH